ncbi:MAG: glycosyltransferase [Anaerolineaceae bacterium]|nr:glycosyltransferase [Anaerolineaceae bacterium]
MKIAVIAPSFVPSNAANSIQVMKVCQALKKAGAEIALWVPLKKGQLIPEPVDWHKLQQFYGIEVTFETYWVPENLKLKRYDFALKATLAAKRWGADVIYTWMVQSAIFAKWQGLIPVLELHMMPTGNLGPFLLKSFVQSKGKKLLLPITDALLKKLERVHTMRFEKASTQIAPMGSEPERYKDIQDSSTLRAELGLKDTLTVAYTGHLYEGRGMSLLMALAKRFPQVPFLWIGGREKDVKRWQEKIDDTGLVNVTLTGFVENAKLPKYQAAADILLMPYSQTVGISGKGDTADVCSPMKLFDYLSAGRAIVASDLPVFHEVLNEDNAVFCTAEDVVSWEAALKRLIDDDVFRKRLAENAKQDAHIYSWLSRAEKTVAHLEIIMKE